MVWVTVTSPLWDETYQGPRWRYGLQYRPAGYGTVPAGWIVFSDRPHPNYRFGTLDWPYPLEERVAKQYDLVLVEQS